MKTRQSRTAVIAWAIAACCALPLRAEDQSQVVLDGLDKPCGVAVQPETGQVFVSESGTGRVLRLAGDKAQDVITGFARQASGPGSKYHVGPLGLAFANQENLLVGGAGAPDDQGCVRVYAVPGAGAPPIQASQVKQQLGPLAKAQAAGNSYGVTVTKKWIFATCHGDHTKGSVVKAEIVGAGFGKLRPFLATGQADGMHAPAGLTVSPQGYVVIGQMGQLQQPRDSQLSFYHADSGKLLLNLKTGLHDIVALAYSPQGQLYALDFAWMAPAEGGLFRLDAHREENRQVIKAAKILALDKPTALAFAEDGALYITVFGPAPESQDTKTGQLLKIAAGL